MAWSELSRDDFSDDYWPKLWGWYANGGDRHVAAYLAARDLSAFDATAPPPKTAAFWDIVDVNRAPEDAECKVTLLIEIDEVALALSSTRFFQPQNGQGITFRTNSFGTPVASTR